MGFLKLKCVSETKTLAETISLGFFRTKEVKSQEKVDGLTEGKIYKGVVTETAESYGAFMIYDDNGQWKVYDDHHFAPAEE